MSAIDGGPAFPNLDFRQCGDSSLGTTSGGMSLRDYFAAQVSPSQLQCIAYPMTPESAEIIAKASYMIADAMLEARKVAPGGVYPKPYTTRPGDFIA